MDIKYLTNRQIDKYKWDKCISESFNGIVYAYAWYLDIVSYNWEALVLGDYETVMPLPVRRKYGVSYLSQPQYAPQLGVFSRKLITTPLIADFINHIPKKYKIIDLFFNTYNQFEDVDLKAKITKNITYELDLITDYKYLSRNFSKYVKKNLNKARQNSILVKSDLNLKDLLLFARRNAKTTSVSFESLNKLRRLIPFGISNNIGKAYGAYNDKNELIATMFFMKSNYKVICLLSEQSKEGIESGGVFAILNQFIKDNSGKSITLDFRNSDNQQIIDMFTGFGAKDVNFNHLFITHLPFIVRRFIHRRR